MHDPNEQITTHFKRHELECTHCHNLVIVRECLDKVEMFRVVIDQAFTPNSFYRCAIHNATISGAPNSFHVRGMACDIPVNLEKNMAHDRIVFVAKQVGFRGIEICSTWVHVDVRPDHWFKDMRS